MSELIVVGFNNPEEADRVLLRLSKLRKEYLVDIENAVVVVRTRQARPISSKALILSQPAQHRVFFPAVYGHLCGTGIPEPVGRICSRQHNWSRSRRLNRFSDRPWH